MLAALVSARIPIGRCLELSTMPLAPWDLHLGYRSLNSNITGSEDRLGFIVHLRGPIIAGACRF